MLDKLISLFSENQLNAPLTASESYLALVSSKPIREIIQTSISEYTPPLWNLIEWLLFNFVGNDEIHIRGLAFAFYLLTAFFVYKIGNTWFGAKTGLWAALLTLSSTTLFASSLTGNGMSLTTFTITASCFFLIKMQKGEEDRRFATPLYILFTTFSIYTANISIFVVLVHLLWMIYLFLHKKPATAKRVLKGIMFSIILSLPWLIVISRQISQIAAINNSTDLEFIKSLLLKALQGGQEGNFIIPYSTYEIQDFALWVTLAILATRRWHRRLTKTIFLILWILSPLAAHYFFNNYVATLSIKNLIVVAPALALLLSSNRRRFSRWLIIVLIAINVITNFNYFINPNQIIDSKTNSQIGD